MKIEVFIEKGLDGTFDVHFGEQTKGLTFGLLGQGVTVQEAIADFYNSRDEIKAYYSETDKPFPKDLEFIFKYDTASFLTYYSHVFSLAGLGRLTGVAQGQLSHYVTGRRKPSPKTVLKIERSLHQFAAELKQLQLIS